MHIAITGVSGRLGGYVRRALEGHELRELDIAAPAAQSSDFRAVDLRDLTALMQRCRGSRSWCILAASIARWRSMMPPPCR